MSFKVIHEKSICIGCGACVAVCPNRWEMGDDGFSHLKGSKKEDGNEVLEVEDDSDQKAADVCPVSCISVNKS